MVQQSLDQWNEHGHSRLIQRRFGQVTLSIQQISLSSIEMSVCLHIGLGHTLSATGTILTSSKLGAILIGQVVELSHGSTGGSAHATIRGHGIVPNGNFRNLLSAIRQRLADFHGILHFDNNVHPRAHGESGNVDKLVGTKLSKLGEFGISIWQRSVNLVKGSLNELIGVLVGTVVGSKGTNAGVSLSSGSGNGAGHGLHGKSIGGIIVQVVTSVAKCRSVRQCNLTSSDKTLIILWSRVTRDRANLGNSIRRNQVHDFNGSISRKSI
mmetsp:Transcript_31219/g.75097  ORF Transcript_31219/g.75097 Transcript_31219/m.75097 type:complete len:268 (+) Transcript_31219:982-1785(+)